MLVLTRKHQEKIRIGDNITITILKTKGKAVRVGIEAPSEIAVVRGELVANEMLSQSMAGEVAPVSTAARAERRVPPARPLSAWGPESRPTQVDALRRGQPVTNISLQRVPRKSVAQVLPRLIGESGPLRSMMDQRATV